ncbi:hypothetical protein BDV18DRAFT_155666 [Aspergillus unguis]
MPGEILMQIGRQLAGADPVTDPYAYLYDHIPASLCLVNKHWNNVFTPFLYGHFRFTSHPHQTKSLWLFLRTLVHRPDLAEHVRQLTLFNSDYDADYDCDQETFLRSLKHLYDDNEDWLKHAIKQVQWDKPTNDNDTLGAEALETLNISIHSSNMHRIEYSYRNTYHKPLLSLVCAHCPNVLRANLQLYELDFFFEDILCRAGYAPLDPHGPAAIAFQNLADLSIAPRDYHCAPHARPFVVTCISLERPFWRLPALKSLHAVKAYAALGWDSPVTDLNHASKIENLSIGLTDDDYNLEALLSAVPNLKQLAVSLPTQFPERHGPTLHQRLWDALLPLKDQLEYLDIHQDAFQALSSEGLFPGDTRREFCPPLAQFTALEHLNLTPLLLAGYNCEHLEPTKCRSHLPPGLVSLGIYTENQTYLLEHFGSLQAELGSLVVPSLRAIVIDSTGVDGYDFPPLDDLYAAVRRRNGAVWRDEYNTGKSTDVELTVDATRHLFFAGVETPFVRIASQRMRTGQALVLHNETRVREAIPWPMEEYHFKGELGRRKRVRLN